MKEMPLNMESFCHKMFILLASDLYGRVFANTSQVYKKAFFISDKVAIVTLRVQRKQIVS